MAITPTIVSPGVEIREYDRSTRPAVPGNTTVWIPGFAASGPTSEVNYISSLDEFVTMFGLPTNAAERYFYATVSQVLQSAATVAVTRLPYGDGEGDTTSPQFTILAYPAKGYTIKSVNEDGGPVYEAATKYSDGSELEGHKGSTTLLIGEPTQFTISLEQYYNLLNGQNIGGTGEFEWSDTPGASKTLANLGEYAFFTVNIAKTVTNDQYEGFYLALSDNAFSNPEEDYESIKTLKTVAKNATAGNGLTADDYISIPTSRLDFNLSGTNKGCISQIMQESINDFDISGNLYNDTLNFGLFKIRESTSGDALKLSAVFMAGFNAALEAGRKTTSKYSTSAVNFFIEDIAKEKSNNTFGVFVNPHITRDLNVDGTPKVKMRMYTDKLVAAVGAATEVNDIEHLGINKTSINAVTGIAKVDALYPLGLYVSSTGNNKKIGNVPAKVTTACNLISNEELYNIDIITEAGLGEIYVGAQDNNGIFDDTKLIAGVTKMRTGKSTLETAAETVIDNFAKVRSAFLKLATSQQDGGRGDVFFIGDGIRQISVEGKDNKIEKKYGMTLKDDVKHSFSTSIYWPLRHLFNGVASSYMAVYPQYIKLADPNDGSSFWAPSSGAIARKMAATDALYGPWQAAAGLNNGVLSDVIDISYTTNQRQRDDLYKISLNTIVSSPSAGITIWGIRTMIKKDSAFDQITCRRTFLYMEKILRDTSRQFLFEGNTVYTRERVTQTLRPVFDAVVAGRGIYDYVLIVDQRNNTDEVIDQGYMVIDFYASPVRTAERILINATATTSGTIVTEYDA